MVLATQNWQWSLQCCKLTFFCMTVIWKDVQYALRCWHCKSSACLWCQKCHTFAVGVAPLMLLLVFQLLVAFLQLCVDWNAKCVFSEGAIRNYQVGSSLGEYGGWVCTYLYCGGEQLAHLKVHFSHSAPHSQCVGSNLMHFRNVYVKVREPFNRSAGIR